MKKWTHIIIAVVVAILMATPCYAQSKNKGPESGVGKYSTPTTKLTLEQRTSVNENEIVKLRSDVALLKFKVGQLEQQMNFLYAILAAIMSEAPEQEEKTWHTPQKQ